MTECREQGERSSGSSDGERRGGARGEEAREHERERGGAHRVEARMAMEVTLSTAKGGAVVASASSACRPRGAVGLTRSGARGAAVSERARGREVDVARQAWAGFAGWAGWLASACQ